MASLSRFDPAVHRQVAQTDEPVVAGNPRELQERLRQLVRARERRDLRRAPERREREAVARSDHAPAPSADPRAEAFEVQAGECPATEDAAIRAADRARSSITRMRFQAPLATDGVTAASASAYRP